MKTSLENAAALGADTVLLVPAVVNPKTRYAEAHDRSKKEIRKLVPLAERLGVTIAVENVWNKFLLSPLEFAEYVDQFESKRVRAYFDIGNIVAYGFPQDWIRTLRDRIVKLHAKDFDAGKHQWKPLLEGSIDWKEVRAALREIDYNGWMTAELPGGDETYLKDVSERMTKIVAG
jgi:hexulose-6-phosphate isomerase